jgi:hypothetical protein
MTTDSAMSNADDFLMERAAEVAAMSDPSNWGPFCGAGYWPVSDAVLADTLADADIMIHEDGFDGFEYIEGYLGADRAHMPFLCVKTLVPGGVHLLAVPGLHE